MFLDPERAARRIQGTLLPPWLWLERVFLSYLALKGAQPFDEERKKKVAIKALEVLSETSDTFLSFVSWCNEFTKTRLFARLPRCSLRHVEIVYPLTEWWVLLSFSDWYVEPPEADQQNKEVNIAWEMVKPAGYLFLIRRIFERLEDIARTSFGQQWCSCPKSTGPAGRFLNADLRDLDAVKPYVTAMNKEGLLEGALALTDRPFSCRTWVVK